MRPIYISAETTHLLLNYNVESPKQSKFQLLSDNPHELKKEKEQEIKKIVDSLLATEDFQLLKDFLKLTEEDIARPLMPKRFETILKVVGFLIPAIIGTIPYFKTSTGGVSFMPLPFSKIFAAPAGIVDNFLLSYFVLFAVGISFIQFLRNNEYIHLDSLKSINPERFRSFKEKCSEHIVAGISALINAIPFIFLNVEVPFSPNIVSIVVLTILNTVINACLCADTAFKVENALVKSRKKLSQKATTLKELKALFLSNLDKGMDVLKLDFQTGEKSIDSLFAAINQLKNSNQSESIKIINTSFLILKYCEYAKYVKEDSSQKSNLGFFTKENLKRNYFRYPINFSFGTATFIGVLGYSALLASLITKAFGFDQTHLDYFLLSNTFSILLCGFFITTAIISSANLLKSITGFLSHPLTQLIEFVKEAREMGFQAAKARSRIWFRFDPELNGNYVAMFVLVGAYCLSPFSAVSAEFLLHTYVVEALKKCGVILPAGLVKFMSYCVLMSIGTFNGIGFGPMTLTGAKYFDIIRNKNKTKLMHYKILQVLKQQISLVTQMPDETFAELLQQWISIFKDPSLLKKLKLMSSNQIIDALIGEENFKKLLKIQDSSLMIQAFQDFLNSEDENVDVPLIQNHSRFTLPHFNLPRFNLPSCSPTARIKKIVLALIEAGNSCFNYLSFKMDSESTQLLLNRESEIPENEFELEQPYSTYSPFNYRLRKFGTHAITLFYPITDGGGGLLGLLYALGIMASLFRGVYPTNLSVNSNNLFENEVTITNFVVGMVLTGAVMISDHLNYEPELAYIFDIGDRQKKTNLLKSRTELLVHKLCADAKTFSSASTLIKVVNLFITDSAFSLSIYSIFLFAGLASRFLFLTKKFRDQSLWIKSLIGFSESLSIAFFTYQITQAIRHNENDAVTSAISIWVACLVSIGLLVTARKNTLGTGILNLLKKQIEKTALGKKIFNQQFPIWSKKLFSHVMAFSYAFVDGAGYTLGLLFTMDFSKSLLKGVYQTNFLLTRKELFDNEQDISLFYLSLFLTSLIGISNHLNYYPGIKQNFLNHEGELFLEEKIQNNKIKHLENALHTESATLKMASTMGTLMKMLNLIIPNKAASLSLYAILTLGGLAARFGFLVNKSANFKMMGSAVWNFVESLVFMCLSYVLYEKFIKNQDTAITSAIFTWALLMAVGSLLVTTKNKSLGILMVSSFLTFLSECRSKQNTNVVLEETESLPTKIKNSCFGHVHNLFRRYDPTRMYEEIKGDDPTQIYEEDQRQFEEELAPEF